MKLTPYKPTADLPWNLQRVWMLHRRIGYGATWEELQRDLADGPAKTIDRFIGGKVRVSGVPDSFAEMRKILGDSAVTSGRSERLIAWWVYQMYLSPDPLTERLCTMWHNHFATSNAKVDDLQIMQEQNEIFRNFGKAKFETLLAKTIKHPAILKWLDGVENRVGKPNENLGRELLELFTLGIGNYTEADVKDASRALTGWTVKDDAFYFRDDWHDDQTKTILGKSGKFDGDDLLEIVTSHEATASRLAWRICDEFLSRNVVNDELVGEVSKILKTSGLDISVAVETLLRSEIFFSEANFKHRIVDPESFIIGTVRAVEIFEPPASTMVLADWLEQAGRKLFYPPNVGGWPGGRAWLNSRTAVARANFGATLVGGNLKRDGVAPDFRALAKKYTQSTETTPTIAFYCELLTGERDEKLIADVERKSSDGDVSSDQVLKRAVALILASPAAQLC